MSERNHWESLYGKKAPDEVSWYRPHLERSLRFIDAAGLPRNAAILDVGGGASTLVDDLLERGYSDVTVLDLSAAAMARARERLEARAKDVQWLTGDVTRMALLERRFDFWHDRAVFHFLTEAAARERYVAAVRRALRPNGHILVATFGPEGPERCSGLPVMRYSAEGIHEQFGGEFQRVGSEIEHHTTPWGSEQEFMYCYCRMPGDAARPGPP
jgi:SAM-dependent methyltransferase